MTQTVTIGRTVNFVLAEGEIRPMTVVKVWDALCVNGVQLRDGSNDDKFDGCVTPGQTSHWRTSVSYDPDKKPGTWHWPEIASAGATTAKAATATKATTAKAAAKPKAAAKKATATKKTATAKKK